MKILLLKTPHGFVPADDESVEAMKKFKAGDYYQLDLKEMRNAKFHRKFFAMMRVGFDHWDPPLTEHNGHPVQKNFKRFWKDVVIAAGYYDLVVNFRGEPRADANSIAFGNMSEEDFEGVYNKCADVLLQGILKNYTKPDLEEVVKRMLDFTTHGG